MVAKILVPLALSPIVAGLVALAATWVAYWLAACADRGLLGRFRAAQVVSASFVALAHGTNDAQKTMGVITQTLITAGLLPAHSALPLCHHRRRPRHRAGHRHKRLADHPYVGQADRRHQESPWPCGGERQHGRHPQPAHLGFGLSTT
jgi:hypothetical protein